MNGCVEPVLPSVGSKTVHYFHWGCALSISQYASGMPLGTVYKASFVCNPWGRQRMHRGTPHSRGCVRLRNGRDTLEGFSDRGKGQNGPTRSTKQVFPLQARRALCISVKHIFLWKDRPEQGQQLSRGNLTKA